MPHSVQRVRPGVFVRPPSAQRRDAQDDTDLLPLWAEVGPCWAYPKPDGWRLQVHKVGSQIDLLTRNQENRSNDFPALVQLVQSCVHADTAVLDTELVGFD